MPKKTRPSTMGDVWHRIATKAYPGRSRKSGRYIHVQLCDGRGNIRIVLLHQLMAEVFLGPCPPGMEVRHLDGNSHNNAIDNLAYGTPLENAADKVRHGMSLSGERNPSVKLTEADVMEIRRLRGEGWKLKALALRYGVDQAHISCICLRKTWKHLI